MVYFDACISFTIKTHEQVFLPSNENRIIKVLKGNRSLNESESTPAIIRRIVPSIVGLSPAQWQPDDLHIVLNELVTMASHVNVIP